MEDEKCYIFKPSSTNRPAKRQRVSSALDTSWPVREQLYHKHWTRQHARLQAVVDDANRAIFDEILAFLHEENSSLLGLHSIKAGYVLAGLDTTSHASIFETLEHKVKDRDDDIVMITVRAGDAPNLKTLLKVVIRRVLNSDRDAHLAENARLLDYDLKAVQSWMPEQGKATLVFGIVDSEAFQASVVADLIDLLSSWQDRISVVLLFGIATSIEIFQDRLPRATLLAIHATQFDVVQSDELLDRMFDATISTQEEDMLVRIGPGLASTILQRQRENIQSPQDFMNALQYAYMCHFFANFATIVLDDTVNIKNINKDVFRYLRYTSSFKRITEKFIRDGDYDTAADLLESDEALLAVVKTELQSSCAKLSILTDSVRLLEAAKSCFKASTTAQPLSTIYLAALKGDIRGSAMLREFLLGVKKASSNTLTEILSSIAPFVAQPQRLSFQAITQKFEQLIEKVGNSKSTLKSQYDLKNHTIRTTVVAQKVELSRHKASISEEDAAYSKIIEEFHDWLADYLEETLIPLSEVHFNEVLVFDNKGPDKAVFMPRHRYVVERALSSPHDYLNCDCCKSTARNSTGEAALTKTQPCTALLYQLYTESGALINAADLWSAFNGILSEDDDEDEHKNMYLFQRALAELRYLGLVRGTKRKTDHLVKVSWKGI